MAKSLPRVRPGVLARSRNLLEANIRMFLLDQLMKNDDEPIAVADLVNLTKEPRERVIDCLNQMTNDGKLPRPSGYDWNDVGAFELNQFRIETDLAERADEDKNGQGRLDLAGSNAVPVDRKKLGTEFFLNDADDTRHDVFVKRLPDGAGDGTLCYSLDVTVRDVGSEDEPIRPFQDIQFANQDEAWEWWDKYKHDHNALDRARALSVELDHERWLFEESIIGDVDHESSLTLSPSAFAECLDRLELAPDLVQINFKYTDPERTEWSIKVEPADEDATDLPDLCDKCALASFEDGKAVCEYCNLPVKQSYSLPKETKEAFDLIAWATDLLVEGEALLQADAFAAVAAAFEVHPYEDGDLTRIEVSLGDATFYFVLSSEGHPLPDLDEPATPDSEPEGEGLSESDADHTVDVVLLDGSLVTVAIKAKGAGWYDVVSTGPINEAGEKRESKRDTRIKTDPEGWAFEHADGLRRAFVEATGG